MNLRYVDLPSDAEISVEELAKRIESGRHPNLVNAKGLECVIGKVEKGDWRGRKVIPLLKEDFDLLSKDSKIVNNLHGFMPDEDIQDFRKYFKEKYPQLNWYPEVFSIRSWREASEEGSDLRKEIRDGILSAIKLKFLKAFDCNYQTVDFEGHTSPNCIYIAMKDAMKLVENSFSLIPRIVEHSHAKETLDQYKSHFQSSVTQIHKLSENNSVSTVEDVKLSGHDPLPLAEIVTSSEPQSTLQRSQEVILPISKVKGADDALELASKVESKPVRNSEMSTAIQSTNESTSSVSSSLQLEGNSRVFEKEVSNPRGVRYIKLPEVIKRTGLSKSTIYARLDVKSKSYDETFPKRRQLGTAAVGWVEAEIDAWCASRSIRGED